ncbi:glycosyltransferase [Anaerobaca lacustris]|uniref:Glycosyltransferase n=1 Tax=Anaerobaca lacustris TaxID=3044600 RepID=A0AAW6TUY4_9BACT|nr:glycosyltransferase [Sedimentisphaerales bacterium M17dextr]
MCARRILYLSKGGNIGGSHRQLLLLLRGLDASYDPTVVCMTEGEVVEELRSAGIRTEVLSLRPWRKLRNGLCRYWDAEKLVALARRSEPVCIHASDMWLGNYLNWLRWRLQVPSVVHVRGPVTRRGVRKHRLRAATGVISISEKITRVLREVRVDADRMVQIEDAVDIERFKPSEARPVDLSRPRGSGPVLNVGLVGRIEPAKRQLEFIRTAIEVKRRWAAGVRFILIGEVRNHDYGARVNRLVAASGLNGQFIFTGRRHDMPSVLNSLDVLVSLSGGSVMYEAMSCGLCVVSAGFTKPGESIHLRDGETAVVTPTADPVALARVLDDLLRRPERRRRLGAAARVWAEQKLSYRSLVARTTAFYDHLLTGAP